MFLVYPILVCHFPTPTLMKRPPAINATASTCPDVPKIIRPTVVMHTLVQQTTSLEVPLSTSLRVTPMCSLTRAATPPVVEVLQFLVPPQEEMELDADPVVMLIPDSLPTPTVEMSTMSVRIRLRTRLPVSLSLLIFYRYDVQCATFVQIPEALEAQQPVATPLVETPVLAVLASDVPSRTPLGMWPVREAILPLVMHEEEQADVSAQEVMQLQVQLEMHAVVTSTTATSTGLMVTVLTMG
ncbi:hypothetical protein C8Q75DRAFT_298267 [Abortiporus biennis]|nr:hypothetical protein C8Q75DRAFT_298267 [Abortiporus biennis]